MNFQIRKYLNSLQIECKEVLRLGNVGDGGWNICNDDEYRPRKNCTVISIGINNDFSFDDAIANEYGCMVYSFDPSMDKKDYRRSDHVQFYAIGLSANDSPLGNWKMNRLQTIKRKLGLSKIDVLKMDIEENEQTTITDMFANNTMDGVLQFVFEIHVDSNAVTKSKNAKTDLSPRRNKYLQSLANLRIIYNAGYRIFSAHQNPYSLFRYKKTRTRFTCHEISTIKIKLD
ncbi:hypothetical protein KUTeg_023671 [Tegillarca granosa]|uniref:Methyltransferase domain-containing protein n=1 Tax=Tegillarca granosa TaxID=220873 RepID=A0ABQ9E5A1_TEGGR|nr:hypothetical protein KUTeg_023671 [Tegillarca granosa]